MEPKVHESGEPASGKDAKSGQSTQVEGLLRMIDALNEQVERCIEVIDDDALHALSSRLGRAQDALHKEYELRKRIPGETLDRLKRNQLPNRVRLNVGRKVFAASLTALTSIKDTFFHSMFGGRWPFTPEADGVFIIGRNPSGFSLVLQFLRGDNIDSSSISECELTAFVDDVDYYGLPVEMVEKWLDRKIKLVGEQFSSQDHGNNLAVTENNAYCHFRFPFND